MSNKLIVFPTKYQIDYICNTETNMGNLYIVCRVEMDNYKFEKRNVAFIDKEIENEELVKILSKDVDVLCCHEEGLYWLKEKGNRYWHFQFSNVVFELLTKDKFKKFLSKNKILNAKCYENELEFPVIAKPIIGFGSIGVKKIDSEIELKKYYSDYEDKVLCSGLKVYQENYFNGEKNSILFEEYISGTFYRTPFIIYNNQVTYIFPVRGNKTANRDNSDFHWSDFEYGQEEKRISVLLKPVLEKLIMLFGLEKGVYVCEFIISDKGEVYLLEFSPRQTSDRIAKIIFLATGIDIEKIAIDIFLTEPVFDNLHDRDIRMLISRNNVIEENMNKYSLVDKLQEKSVYGDSIVSMYYEKSKFFI
ncbi:MAG: ATP-grasp domain-containing protein [Lachnospiraceae bacterium]